MRCCPLRAQEEEEEARRAKEAAARLARDAAASAADGDGGSCSAPYERRDPVSGAPLPLAPELVTLSLLPRSQWDSLAHLEVRPCGLDWCSGHGVGLPRETCGEGHIVGSG